MTHHPTTLRELRELVKTTRLQAGSSTHIEWKRVFNAVAALEEARECPYCQPCAVCGGRGRGVSEDAPIGDILRAYDLLKEGEEGEVDESAYALLKEGEEGEECWQETKDGRRRWKVVLPFVAMGVLSLTPLVVERSLVAAGAAMCGAVALGCLAYVYQLMEGR